MERRASERSSKQTGKLKPVDEIACQLQQSSIFSQLYSPLMLVACLARTSLDLVDSLSQQAGKLTGQLDRSVSVYLAGLNYGPFGPAEEEEEGGGGCKRTGVPYANVAPLVGLDRQINRPSSLE